MTDHRTLWNFDAEQLDPTPDFLFATAEEALPYIPVFARDEFISRVKDGEYVPIALLAVLREHLPSPPRTYKNEGPGWTQGHIGDR